MGRIRSRFTHRFERVYRIGVSARRSAQTGLAGLLLASHLVTLPAEAHQNPVSDRVCGELARLRTATAGDFKTFRLGKLNQAQTLNFAGPEDATAELYDFYGSSHLFPGLNQAAILDYIDDDEDDPEYKSLTHFGLTQRELAEVQTRQLLAAINVCGYGTGSLNSDPTTMLGYFTWLTEPAEDAEGLSYNTAFTLSLTPHRSGYVLALKVTKSYAGSPSTLVMQRESSQQTLTDPAQRDEPSANAIYSLEQLSPELLALNQDLQALQTEMFEAESYIAWLNAQQAALELISRIRVKIGIYLSSYGSEAGSKTRENLYLSLKYLETMEAELKKANYSGE